MPLLAALLPAWLALAPAGDPLDAHYRLANGLEVILRRDPRLPLVAVHLRYHVGAVDDPPARRGLAHLVEHLMFAGSRHIDADARQAARARAFIHHDNGETDLHTSEYYTLVPKDDLATILWLESDRLGFLRGSAGAGALARVKAIVAQERRQRRETDPRGARVERLFARLFPPAHPYHDTVIGPHDAIAAVTLRDVDAFLAAQFTAANSTYKELAVQWLNEALCFVSSSAVADSLRLRNRQLLVAANRRAQCYDGRQELYLRDTKRQFFVNCECEKSSEYRTGIYR